MKCKMCEREGLPMAEAHIFPIGFFRPIPSKGKAVSYDSSGTKGRRLQKAIYDPGLVCRDCESQVLAPLDDYAIRVLRDRQGLFKVISHPDLPSEKFLLFQGINKTKLQQFLASVLWRVSVSQQLELKQVSIGHHFESRIRSDLLNNKSLDYLDAVIFLLTNPFHSAFFVPHSVRIEPKDHVRDPQEVNGWLVHLPFITIVVSLDQRPHPRRAYFSVSPELTGEKSALPCSTSLLAEAEEDCFMAMEKYGDRRMLKEVAGVADKMKGTHNQAL